MAEIRMGPHTYNGKNATDCEMPEWMEVSGGEVVRIGDLVSAEPAGGGKIAEGKVVMLLPWGFKEIHPEWDAGAVVIEDHETKDMSHWQPKNVTKLVRK